MTKTLDEFDLGVSSVPKATFAYLASLEWVTPAENLASSARPLSTGPDAPSSMSLTITVFGFRHRC